MARPSVLGLPPQNADPAVYMRAYRAVNPDRRALERARDRAKSRARIRLANIYEYTYRRLLAEECAKEGVAPPRESA